MRHVYNELRLGKPVSIGVRSNDTWITSKVRADMLGTKNFDSTKVKVVTENSEVFLIGLVTRQEGSGSGDRSPRQWGQAGDQGLRVCPELSGQ